MYEPNKRIGTVEAMHHPYFKSLPKQIYDLDDSMFFVSLLVVVFASHMPAETLMSVLVVSVVKNGCWKVDISFYFSDKTASVLFRIRCLPLNTCQAPEIACSR